MTRTLACALLTCATLAAAACGGDGGMTTPPDTTTRTYEADDANIQYTGRIDFTNPKQPKFALAATYMTVRFRGMGVAVLLKDEHRYGKWRNYYDAIVDGMVVKKIRPEDDAALVKYEVATGLTYGEHELVVVKRTEPNVGNGFFFGVEFAGEIAAAAGAAGAQAAVLRRFDHGRLRRRGARRRSGLHRRRVGPAGRERGPRLRPRGRAPAGRRLSGARRVGHRPGPELQQQHGERSAADADGLEPACCRS